jgi:RNA polymerase sigma-70 factor (ECF subfamily)
MNVSKLREIQVDKLGELSDEQLIRRVKNGCHSAMAVVFDRYHRLVFSVAARIVRDFGEAEEVVQVVFLDIYRAAASFDPAKGILKVWILQYAYHRALHRKRHLVANHFYNWEGLEAAIAAGAQRALSAEMQGKVRLAEQLLQKLNPRQRAAVEMTYFEGLTAEEVAARVGHSVHIVRHDLHRGLAALRASLKSAND